ncbi:hypothetical protein QFZ75_001027 [Streptomyces sp. V3I8]|nr:hypothetical protein [Streptomyces sp. V3I8]
MDDNHAYAYTYVAGTLIGVAAAQPLRQCDGWTPKAAAICSSVTPGSWARATRTASSWNSLLPSHRPHAAEVRTTRTARVP